MVRIIIKGGVWRNTEDSILLAAVSKYGKNQWARISSLLVRKTPKQCKARWYEWLDPSIKKIEWSKTEDEKLLHLAKLMPTQWRTIAPIVGRTATQCLERYQKLLDDAEAKDNEELGLGTGDNVDARPAEGGAKGLRQGEIDTDPETRAARPDPIDMDDDEKEMLSEARARLANTQGKKAKRKARERQLEEARRLAYLQKKRELKAAGINLQGKKKKKGMDYNADIPFEKQPAPGFYDVAEEQAKVYSAPIGQSLRAAEGKRKQEIEEMEEKRNKKQKNDGGNKPGSATQFVAAREAQIKKLKEQEQVIRRRKLALPVPQVGERELEEIVKIGQAGEAARDLVRGEGAGGDATGQLVGEYEGLSQARMARTPRVAAQQDNVLTEARNLRNMIQTQTPLLGDENTPMRGLDEGTGFESATPRHNIAPTPNPLMTPSHGATPRGAGPIGATPGATPMRTPMRDSLNINDAGSAWGETPADDRRRARDARRALKAGFASLPRPENNFELADVDDEEGDEDEGVVLTEEDAAERDARMKAARAEEERRERERRSSVVKKGLPRPANVDERAILARLQGEETEMDAAIEAINREVAALMKHDSVAHPIPGAAHPGGTVSSYDMPDDEFVALAKSAIHTELATALGLPGASDEQLRVVLSSQAEEGDVFAASWAEVKGGLVFSPSKGAWVDPKSLTKAQLVESYTASIEASRERVVAEATKAAKAEKKLAKQLGGYAALNAKARKGIVDTIEEIQQAKRELETFRMLKGMEEAAVPERLESKRMEVEKLERREADLQQRYAEMNDERRQRVEAIEQLEEEKTILLAQAAFDAQEPEADGDE